MNEYTREELQQLFLCNAVCNEFMKWYHILLSLHLSRSGWKNTSYRGGIGDGNSSEEKTALRDDTWQPSQPSNPLQLFQFISIDLFAIQ